MSQGPSFFQHILAEANNVPALWQEEVCKSPVTAFSELILYTVGPGRGRKGKRVGGGGRRGGRGRRGLRKRRERLRGRREGERKKEREEF